MDMVFMWGEYMHFFSTSRDTTVQNVTLSNPDPRDEFVTSNDLFIVCIHTS